MSKGHTTSPTRALTTIVWVPAIAGRWPLVVFAHGYQVGPQPYAQLCATWAAAGYIVAAPEFPLTDAAIAGPNLDENDITNQPADVRFVISALLAPTSRIAQVIQPDRLAVAGHSDGAETALAVSANNTLGLRAAIALSAAPIGNGPMANPPLLVVQGDQDTTNDPQEAEAVYRTAAPPRYLLHLLGAGHLPPFAEATKWQDVVDRTTIDFLDDYVSGRPAAGRQLLRDATAGLATMDADT